MSSKHGKRAAGRKRKSGVVPFSGAGGLASRMADAALERARRSIFESGGDMRGKTLEAMEELDRVIAVAPGEWKPRWTRATLRTLHGDQEGAVLDFSAAIANHPTGARCWLSRAMWFHEAGEYWEALLDADRAVGLAPADRKARVQRGNTRAALGDEWGALEDWARGVQGLGQEAIDAGEIALDLDVSPAEIPIRQAQLRQRGDDRTPFTFEPALAALDAALAASPEKHRLHAGRARVLYLLGRRDEAIAAVQRALENPPEGEEIKWIVGPVMMELGLATKPLPPPDSSARTPGAR